MKYSCLIIFFLFLLRSLMSALLIIKRSLWCALTPNPLTAAVINTGVGFLILFYNDHLSHPVAGKIMTYASVSHTLIVANKGLRKLKNRPKKIFNQKRCLAKTFFWPKKWSGHGRTSHTMDDGLVFLNICMMYAFTLLFSLNLPLNEHKKTSLV